MQKPRDEYIRHAEVVRVVDGDTIRLRVDLGFNTQVTQNFRLWGIDAPELRGDERVDGLKAKEFLSSIVSDRDWETR